MSIHEELSTATKVKRKDGEGEQEFLRRLFGKANTLSEEAWEGLSEDTQKWVNSAAESVEQKKLISSLGENGADGEAKVVSPKAKAKKAEADAKSSGKKAAVVEKASSEKSSARKSVKEASGKRGRPSKFKGGEKITVLKDNPHRVGSKDHDRFKLYKSGMTVAKALEKGARSTDINWYATKGHISVE